MLSRQQPRQDTIHQGTHTDLGHFAHWPLCKGVISINALIKPSLDNSIVHVFAGEFRPQRGSHKNKQTNRPTELTGAWGVCSNQLPPCSVLHSVLTTAPPALSDVGLCGSRRWNDASQALHFRLLVIMSVVHINVKIIRTMRLIGHCMLAVAAVVQLHAQTKPSSHYTLILMIFFQTPVHLYGNEWEMRCK